LDGDSVHKACDAMLASYKHNTVAGCAQPLDSANGALWSITNYVSNQNTGNIFLPASTDLQLIDPYNDTLPNALPYTTSPLLNAASFAYPELAVAAITPVSYTGAFGASNWTLGWTNWNPQDEPYLFGYSEPTQVSANLDVQDFLYPNPANNVLCVGKGLAPNSKVIVYNSQGHIVTRHKVTDKNSIINTSQWYVYCILRGCKAISYCKNNSATLSHSKLISRQ
jgi:hypothetical protein